MTCSLTDSLQAWNHPDFAQTLQAELLRSGALVGPLQQGMAHGSYALQDDVRLLVLQTEQNAARVRVKTGVCYSSIIPGCACEGDPTPMSELPEYVVLRIDIDRASGLAEIALIDD
jgi:hypothetical protein